MGTWVPTLGQEYHSWWRSASPRLPLGTLRCNPNDQIDTVRHITQKFTGTVGYFCRILADGLTPPGPQPTIPSVMNYLNANFKQSKKEKQSSNGWSG